MSASEGLRAAILLVGWPGMALIAGFVLLKTLQFHARVKGSPFGRLVLFTVVGWTLTMGFLAFFATLLLQQDPVGAGPLAAAFLVVWSGTMASIVWIVHRWGEEAVHINLYYTELATMDRVKSQLIDTMAHELNTPLTPILLKFEMLRRGRFGPLSPDQDVAVQAIERNLGRLQLLVDQVVLATQLQTGELRVGLAPVEAGNWMRKALAPFATQLFEEKRELKVSEPSGEVLLDPRRMDQVLSSVVQNALRYSPPGSSIEVDGSIAGGRLTITVRDQGRGFTPEQAGLLFQPFRHLREHSADASAGAGLSLYLAKGLVAAHGGVLSAHSPGPGKGATFQFWIPVQPNANGVKPVPGLGLRPKSG